MSVYLTSALSVSNPKGITKDTEFNRILIVDSDNNKVILARPDLSTITTQNQYFGANQGDNFSSPHGVTYLNGYFYVCDTGNHTVVRLRARDLSAKGFFGDYGVSGSTNTKLSSPSEITNDGTYLYVVDVGNARIMKILASTFTYTAKTSSINGLISPVGIAYGNDALFISDQGTTKRVLKCQTDFTYTEQLTSIFSASLLPYSLTFNDDSVYVSYEDSDTGSDVVKVLASNGLAVQTTLNDLSINRPLGMMVDNDSIFISDSGNDRILVWRKYNPRDSFTASTPMKFGGVFFDNPYVIVDDDTLVVGATQEAATVNRWKEENSNNYIFVEESSVSSTWTEE